MTEEPCFVGKLDWDEDYVPHDPMEYGTAPWTPFGPDGKIRDTLFTEEGCTQIGALTDDD